MLMANDVSHNNDLQELYTNLLFIKASEGKTYVDKKHNEWVRLMGEQALRTAKTTPYIGFYHYARPDNGNTPLEEFTNYKNAVDGHSGFAVALDWEGKALNVPNGEKWALEWLRMAEKTLHTIPMFYVQASSVDKYRTIAENYPLWVACYSQDSRANKYKRQMRLASMIQIASNPLDVDIWMQSEQDLVNMINGNR